MKPKKYIQTLFFAKNVLKISELDSLVKTVSNSTFCFVINQTDTTALDIRIPAALSLFEYTPQDRQKNTQNTHIIFGVFNLNNICVSDEMTLLLMTTGR